MLVSDSVDGRYQGKRVLAVLVLVPSAVAHCSRSFSALTFEQKP